VFLIPPTLGLSNTLLNKNHHEVYYEGIEPYMGKILRRHGDQLELLENGYFKAQGRIDDSMNLGGIKVSSIQIEELTNTLYFVKESAAVSVPPKEGGPEKLLLFYVASKEIPKNEAFLEISTLIKTKLNPLFKVYDVVCLEKLPRTASGKVMRRELRKEYLEDKFVI
jgi:acetyl-CoA synthetase